MDRYGYWNKILHVNLSDRTTRIEEPGDLFFRRYAGGRGLIAHYLLKHVPKGADPLGPDNILVIAPGVLTGAPVPGAGRHSVGAKSPLTGGFGESESGGYWGAELKRAGWDAIVFHGVSPTPVYLWINDGAVEFRDAAHLWGKITGEVEDAILAELGDPRIRIAQIGPAGENLVRFACIANELNEVAGRTGMGAVMGSKRLKAIAVRGKTPVKIADQPGLLAIAKWVSGTMDEKHRAFHEFGTGAAMQGKSLEGGMPVLNYRLGAARHHRQGGRDRGARRGTRQDGRLLRMLGAVQEGRPHREEGRSGARGHGNRLQGKGEGGRRSTRPLQRGPRVTAGRSTSRSPRSASTWVSTTSSRSASPTRCATTSRWTRCRSARLSHGRWSASRRASSRSRTRAASRFASTTPTASSSWSR